MVSMPRLFEAFVTRLVQRACPPSSSVSPQRRDASVLWDLDQNASFGTVRPDVVVASGDGRVVVPLDAKYKRYGEQKLGPADVYQGAIYALTLARGRLPGEVPTCLVLYPLAKGEQARQRVQVRLSETALAEVCAFGIPVDDLLDGGDSLSTGAYLPWLQQLSLMVA
jgi:5-methylcytosine-specific restriction endonuclease McrBC regulatory subunit McrC